MLNPQRVAELPPPEYETLWQAVELLNRSKNEANFPASLEASAYRIMQQCGIDGRKLGYDHMRQLALNLTYKRTLIERLRAHPF